LSNPALSREQLVLYFCYYNAKICITRPCLCRLDQRIKGQSEESARFCQKSAEACIGAALDICSLLPDSPHPQWFYEKGPWWFAVHTSKFGVYHLKMLLTMVAHPVMQGLTVLLLELLLDGFHLTVDKSYVSSCAEKLIQWLASMSSVDAVSLRAYEIVSKVLQNQSEAEADSKQLPRPSVDRLSEQMATLESQSYQPPTSQQQTETVWSDFNTFSSGESFSQAQMGNFYPNDISGGEYLNDPSAGLFDFGQPMLQMYYGNPYQTFDHWEWNPYNFEDQDQGQYPEQGQGSGQGQGQGLGW
jgi:hypothetical protein